MLGAIFVLWVIGGIVYFLWQDSRPLKPVNKSNNISTFKDKKETVNAKDKERTAAVKDNSLGLFLKVLLVPIILAGLLGLLGQCSNKTGSKNTGGSSLWGKSNTCGKGSYFDEFSDGRGQWRSKDGKFCSR